jgi:hypothetical protein
MHGVGIVTHVSGLRRMSHIRRASKPLIYHLDSTWILPGYQVQFVAAIRRRSRRPEWEAKASHSYRAIRQTAAP